MWQKICENCGWKNDGRRTTCFICGNNLPHDSSEYGADSRASRCPVQAGCSRGAERNEATRAGLMGKTAHSRSARRNENPSRQGRGVPRTMDGVVRPEIKGA